MHQQETQIVPIGEQPIELNCRFYEHKYPKEENLVVVEVTEVEENASYVKLLEYNNIKGMITPNEMTRALKGGVQRALKIGQQQIVRVLRVDEEQGYIDLSKKRVQKDEEEECLSRYANSKTVHSILRTLAEKEKINIPQLYEQVVWPLARRKEYDQPLHYFRMALEDGNKAFAGLQITEEFKAKLIAEISRRMKPQPVTIRAEFELQSLEYEGVLIIQKALLAGQKKSQDECQVVFEMFGSPLYSGRTVTADKNKGIKIMREALAEVEDVIVKHKGSFKVKNEPRVIGDKLQDLMDRMQQVEEDDEDEDEEVDGMGDAGDDEVDQ